MFPTTSDYPEWPWRLRSLTFISVQAPVPCEQKVVRLEAEIQGLKNLINDQHRYIQELHNGQAHQLEYIPNSHLGPDNLYRGTDVNRVVLSQRKTNVSACCCCPLLHPGQLHVQICVSVFVCVQTAPRCLLMGMWPVVFMWLGQTALPRRSVSTATWTTEEGGPSFSGGKTAKRTLTGVCN